MSPARRASVLAIAVVAGLVGAIILWLVYEQPWAAVMLAVFTALFGAALKGLFEIAVEARQLRAALSDSLRQFDDFSTRQHDLNGAILDRVRELESVGRRQQGFNDAALDRVRELESVGRRQQGFNDAILSRVRKLEQTDTRGPAPGTPAPPGSERRVGLAASMITAALTAYEQSAFFVPDSERIEETAPMDAGDPEPLLSVVATCYNQERFVADGLESIRAQSYTNWECIVVDDASTDDSVAVIEAAIAGDDRFRLLRQPENRGVVTARNTGIEHASGEFITFHDGDDLLMKYSFADRVETLRSAGDPDVAGVYCGLRIADEGVLLEELPVAEAWTPRTPFVDFVVAEGECPFGAIQPMFRIDVIRALGGFSTTATHAEDWEFWLRMMRRGFVFLPSQLLSIAYRQTAASTTQTGAAGHVDISNDLIESAHSAVAFEDDDLLASYPFPEPLAHYQQVVTRARRAIQYATTALVRSDIDAFDTILGTLEAGSVPLLRRHVAFRSKITDGMRRAAGLDPADLGQLESEHERLISAVTASVELATR